MFRVASIQLWFSDDNSKEERIEQVEDLINSASDCDLILLPELWNIGWFSFDMYRDSSESLDGETVSRIAQKARTVNAYILAGSIVESSGGGSIILRFSWTRKGKSLPPTGRSI